MIPLAVVTGLSLFLYLLVSGKLKYTPPEKGDIICTSVNGKKNRSRWSRFSSSNGGASARETSYDTNVAPYTDYTVYTDYGYGGHDCGSHGHDCGSH